MIALNGVVVMNRGDSQELQIDLKTNFSEFYPLREKDRIYFGIMDPGQPFEEALVRKYFDVKDISLDGVLTIEVTPEDTIDLLPGKYFYAIKLQLDHTAMNDGYARKINKVYTLVNKTKFILCD